MVTVFDKGRVPGGRLATRHAAGLSFDHGAPMIPNLALPGLIPWNGGWVGTPGMAGWAATLAGAVQSGRHVSFLRRDGAGWHVRHHAARLVAPSLVSDQGGDESGPFDGVTLTLPGPQATTLLHAMHHPFAATTGAIRMDPCWTLMAAFDRPGGGNADGRLQTIIPESAKPDRPRHPERWVAHATAAWSKAHLDDSADEVLPALLQALGKGDPTYAAVHRWRYAQTGQALGEPCLGGADRLAYAGDGCAGPGAEAAFRSGEAAAALIQA